MSLIAVISITERCGTTVFSSPSRRRTPQSQQQHWRITPVVVSLVEKSWSLRWMDWQWRICWNAQSYKRNVWLNSFDCRVDPFEWWFHACRWCCCEFNAGIRRLVFSIVVEVSESRNLVFKRFFHSISFHPRIVSTSRFHLFRLFSFCSILHSQISHHFFPSHSKPTVFPNSPISHSPRSLYSKLFPFNPTAHRSWIPTPSHRIQSVGAVNRRFWTSVLCFRVVTQFQNP